MPSLDGLLIVVALAAPFLLGLAPGLLLPAAGLALLRRDGPPPAKLNPLIASR